MPKIVALTGSVFEEEREIALAAGFDDFIRKPARSEVILATMAQHLGIHYIYAEKVEKTEDLSTTPSQIIISDMDQMPQDWREQLHQAATKINLKEIRQLIEQIPLEQAHLNNAVSHLANNLCFEEIIALTANREEGS